MRRYEGVRIDSLARRERWRLFAAFPRIGWRYLRLRFRLQCPLPGETYWAATCDLRARCLGVDGDVVVLELRSGLYAHRYGSDWDSLPAGVVRDVVRVDRRTFVRSDWMPV
jgi:hypothetical protein